MTKIKRSALFKRQLIEMTTSYRDRAGSPVAMRFVDQIEEGIDFLSGKPYACVVYTRLEGKDFRKWTIRGFPVSVFFRIEPDDTIILEALYAHKMNIETRLPEEIE